eukprot:COSAG05_NODE_638_length_8163_cov_16.318452_9_plen_168_part_00
MAKAKGPFGLWPHWASGDQGMLRRPTRIMRGWHTPKVQLRMCGTPADGNQVGQISGQPSGHVAGSECPQTYMRSPRAGTELPVLFLTLLIAKEWHPLVSLQICHAYINEYTNHQNQQVFIFHAMRANCAAEIYGLLHLGAVDCVSPNPGLGSLASICQVSLFLMLGF